MHVLLYTTVFIFKIFRVLFFWPQLTKSRPKGPVNRRLPSSHSGDNIATSPVREEGRREEGRREEGRREEGRREEGEGEQRRRGVGRKEEGVRKEGRRVEGRRGEGEREITSVVSSGKKVPREQRREMVSKKHLT